MKKTAPVTLEVRATPQEVMRAVDALQEFGHTNGLEDKVLFDLALALEECASNIVNHSLHHDPQQTFRVTLERTADAITIELSDRGPEFDPTQHRVSTTEAGQGDPAPGGWGLLLVRRYMDTIRYKREGGNNILQLTKQLGDDSRKPKTSSTKTIEQQELT